LDIKGLSAQSVERKKTRIEAEGISPESTSEIKRPKFPPLCLP